MRGLGDFCKAVLVKALAILPEVYCPGINLTQISHSSPFSKASHPLALGPKHSAI